MPQQADTTQSPTFDVPAGAGDDLYINDGASMGEEYFDQPEERTTAEREEAAQKAASYPALESIEEWFRQQIDACNLPDNILTKPVQVGSGEAVVTLDTKVSVEGQVLAFQLLRQMLVEKHGEFAQFAKEIE